MAQIAITKLLQFGNIINVCKYNQTGCFGSLVRFLHDVNNLPLDANAGKCTNYVQLAAKVQLNDTTRTIDWAKELHPIKQQEQRSVLVPLHEDISDLAPNIIPTFNFAAYINKSETLQELVKLGVDLSKLEKKKGIPQFILKLDFRNDIQKHLLFLHDLGIPIDGLGNFITKNPSIFKECIDDMQTRVHYLESKRFTPPMITRIVENNPFWLMFSTQRIDRRLGFFQSKFQLSGHEVRHLATRQPRLITYNLEHVRGNYFTIKEEMGFEDEEMKPLILTKPKLLMQNPESLIRRFDYVHNTMKIPHDQIVKMPEILGTREFKLQQRHMFLTKLDRAQYDPTKENYVALSEFVKGTDADFCKNIAKSSIESYNMFLRSL